MIGRSHEVVGIAAAMLAASGAVGQSVGLFADAPPALDGWGTLLSFAPQLAFGAALFFAMKYIIDNFRGDIKVLVEKIGAENEARDAANHSAMDEFKVALRESNQSNKEAVTELARQVQLTAMQDREQNAKLSDAMFVLTRDAVNKMGSLDSTVRTLESTVRSLEQEVRSDRRGSALPPPGGASFRPDPRPRDADDPGSPRA